jgi:Flp pilus assembly pilin Flp
MKKLIRNRKGQGLVEYALIIAGVALICAVGISVFGHKVSDLIDATAVVLPGAHQGDNGQISSGHLIETTSATAGTPITLDMPGITAGNGQGRLGNNVLNNPTNGFDGTIVETNSSVP